MSRYNPYYYLLFVLLIFGAFASMAQNDYGIRIIGLVAFTFSLLFLIQWVYELITKRRKDVIAITELLALVIICAILCLRVFYIRFPFVEIVFGAAGFVFIAAYFLRLLQSWQMLQHKSKAMAILVALFHGSIALYAVSMTIVPFVPAVARPAGAAAFACCLLFVAGGLLKKEMLVEGEKLTVFTYVARVRDRSIVLLSLFVLFTAYMGLTQIGAIPKMYSDEFPQRYFELVNQAEAGNEEPINGHFRHEEFKEKYDLFVKRHLETENK